MDDAFEDALVHGWEHLEQSIDLPDPNDRHVVAAAIRGRADVIITQNLKDFPSSHLEPLGLEAISLDEFLLDHYDLNPTGTCQIVADQAAAMNRPQVEIDSLLTRLARSGAPRFAERIRNSLPSEKSPETPEAPGIPGGL